MTTRAVELVVGSQKADFHPATAGESRKISISSLKGKGRATPRKGFERLSHYLGTVVIDPRTTRSMTYWDLLTTLGLVYTALVTPYEVAFLASPAPPEPLFIINQLLTLIFLADLVLQFFLMYPAPATATKQAGWVSDRGKIASNYLKGWFALDLVSVGVSGFDYVSLCFDTEEVCLELAKSQDLDQLRVLRVLRALRLIKLIRLLRASRMLKRWETRVAVNYAMLEITKAFVQTFIVSHWFACIWGLQTAFSTSVMDTWLGGGSYCIEADGPSEPTYTAYFPVDGIACAAPARLYYASLYFSVMTITSIGYGDISATALNSMEQNFCTVLMLAGSFLWAKVVAIFVVAADRDPEEVAFVGSMDKLNKFMRAENLPYDFQLRLREYFMHTKHLRATQRDHDLLSVMSSALQAEVAWKVNERWLAKVPFLRSACTAFLVQLSLHLHPHVFAPGELCPLGMLYILHLGLALYDGKMLGAGKVWGEDIILTSAHLRSSHHARALTFIDVLTIDAAELHEIAAVFPDTIKAIRGHAIRLATRRAFVQQAKIMKLSRPKTPGARGSGLLVPTATPNFDRFLEQATHSDDIRNDKAEIGAIQTAALTVGPRREASRLKTAPPPLSSASSSLSSAVPRTQELSGLEPMAEADAGGASKAPSAGVEVGGDMMAMLRAEMGAIEKVRHSMEEMADQSHELRQTMQRIGNQEQTHGSAIVQIFEELHAVRDAISHLSSQIAAQPAHNSASISSRASRVSHAAPPKNRSKLLSAVRLAQSSRHTTMSIDKSVREEVEAEGFESPPPTTTTKQRSVISGKV